MVSAFMQMASKMEHLQTLDPGEMPQNASQYGLCCLPR